MTLDEMMKLAEGQARRVLIGSKEELVPSWLVVEAGGEVAIYLTPWRNDVEKLLTVEAMRLTMRACNAQAYSFLIEAWTARIQGEEAKAPYTGPPPSQRADRQECVMMMAVNRAGEQRHVHLEIVRDKKGECAELKRTDGPEGSALFDNLLEDREKAN